jgi:hypothetical protein
MSFTRHLSVLVTPKIFRDFDHPLPDAQRFFAHYRELFARFDELRVILAVGNSDHILMYPGRDAWTAEFPWTRYSNYTINTEEKSRKYRSPLQRVVSDARMDYALASALFNALRQAGRQAGFSNLGLLDLIDPGPEFCEAPFKSRHPEIMDLNDPRNPRHVVEDYGFLDFTTTVARDDARFAAYPNGIADGTPTREVVARQAGAYVRELELDGLWLQNALGAVRPWEPHFIDYPDNLELNLKIFSEYKDRLSGIQLWLSDTNGRFLPRPQVEQILRCLDA